MRMRSNRYLLRLAVVLVSSGPPGLLFADDDYPTTDEPAAIEASLPIDGNRDDASKDKCNFQIGLQLGSVSLSTDKRLEVDKKGSVFGLTVLHNWYFDEIILGAGLGVASATTSGSGPMIKGDQTASVTTPILDIHAGYNFYATLSAHFGMQSWFAKGSDFAPEAERKGNQMFYYLKLAYQMDAKSPIGLSAQYLRDLSIKDRDVTMMSIGAHYNL